MQINFISPIISIYSQVTIQENRFPPKENSFLSINTNRGIMIHVSVVENVHTENLSLLIEQHYRKFDLNICYLRGKSIDS